MIFDMWGSGGRGGFATHNQKKHDKKTINIYGLSMHHDLGVLRGCIGDIGKIATKCGAQAHFYRSLKNWKGEKFHRNIKIHGDQIILSSTLEQIENSSCL